MLLNSTKYQKKQPLNLQQLKQFIEAENKLQPIELVSSPINRKVIARRECEEHIERMYQQIRIEVAAKINLQREALLNRRNDG